MGPEYADVRMSDWVYSSNPESSALQRKVISWICEQTGYTSPERQPTLARLTRNIVFMGPVGTGKDRLAAWLVKVAVMERKAVLWFNGPDLFAKARTYMGIPGGEDDFVDHLSAADILVLSDPVPPGGKVTEFQAQFLYRVLDRRGRYDRPTWATVNVLDDGSAQERLTPQVWDRLVAGADVLICNWNSFRRPRSRVGGAH
ncbi:ATP-binding protein [Planctomyces sp. SH-PL14]|uniref:ATP-binding protein n=1 Tax=Planctomyces sp. SH-PL14 TaxID=1632864 RepID=UPI00078C69F2|nr:ATP-binding protein [Planctomyces sp. SH-PL14]AMV18236.1 hypothetical protein VT03_10130 [Planctomyces sp. SH-PL14]